MIIVRKGECISQIMGQFAERVVLQDVPTIALLKQSDFSADVRAGIGKIMSTKSPAPECPPQKGERVAVRLKGTEQEGQFVAACAKSAVTAEQGCGQQFVAAFLHGNSLRK